MSSPSRRGRSRTTKGSNHSTSHRPSGSAPRAVRCFYGSPDVLRALRRRGLKDVRLFIGDGGLGLWAASQDVYPEARHQLYWCHKQ